MGTPKRKFRFVSGSTLTVENTSFEVLYDAAPRDDGPALLSVTLRGAWELPSGADGLTKRKWVEDRLRVLTWDFIGKVGTLTVALQSDGSWGGTGSTVLSNMRLESVSPEMSDNNTVFEYSLEFSVPILNGMIARELSFDGGGAKTLSADAFLVLESGEDRTDFKAVFRAGFVRIPNGPPLKITRIIGIRRALSGASDLIKRQAAEAEFKAWAFTKKGTEGTLTIDGVSQGTHHLQDATAGDLNLLDAMTFELQFVSNYGS